MINFRYWHENSSLLKTFVSTSWKGILNLCNLRIFSPYLKSSHCNGRRKLEAFVISYFPCNFEIVKTHEIFPWALLKKFRIYKDLYGKPCKRGWVAKVVFLIQMLLTFGGRCNRYFWDIRLKILWLRNFNMLSQLVLIRFFKSELFSCLPKVDHMIESCKEPTVCPRG